MTCGELSAEVVGLALGRQMALFVRCVVGDDGIAGGGAVRLCL